MKVTLNNLSGRALNWAVRYALYDRKPTDYVENRDNFVTCDNKAGPIIDTFFISVTVNSTGVWTAYNSYNYFNEPKYMVCGTTRLEAAMRCFVFMKLGTLIDIPEELIND